MWYSLLAYLLPGWGHILIPESIPLRIIDVAVAMFSTVAFLLAVSSAYSLCACHCTVECIDLCIHCVCYRFMHSCRSSQTWAVIVEDTDGV